MARGTLVGTARRNQAKMRARLDRKKGAFLASFMKNEEPIARAATGAMQDAADLAVKSGKARIAAAGFGKRWQQTLYSEVYPDGTTSINAAAHIYHRIPYAIAFEEGASVKGRPWLWIPLPTAPKRVGRMKMTAKRYREKIGPLQFVHRPGKAPLLVENVKMPRAMAKRNKLGKLSMASLRRGSTGRGELVSRSVPMFVGVRQTKIPQKFNITGAVKQASNKVGAFYVRRMQLEHL